MNPAFLHEATNHIPVVGTPLAAALLALGLFRRSRELVRVSFAAFLVIAAIAIVVDLSGDPAARIVRVYPEISRTDIHAHEEAADYGFALAEITGALALIGLWLTRKETQSLNAGWCVLAAALLTTATLLRVAHLGGLIRHPEIRSGAKAPPAAVPR
jgi:hypothetical protein